MKFWLLLLLLVALGAGAQTPTISASGNSLTGNVIDCSLNTCINLPGAILPATSVSIGGTLLAAGGCSTGTVSVTNATTSMAAVATPTVYPGDGVVWHAYVSAAGTVTVKVCAILALTPSSTTYIVRVMP